MPAQINANPNWTIMVYMAADDTLADFAVRSLQQLRRVAMQDPSVVVVAQFDANGKQNIPRLIFDSKGDITASIHDSKQGEIAFNTDMADPLALRDFIDWAYDQRPAKHYCLVLWGHGPELLVDDNAALSGGVEAKRFLTPLDVKDALADSKLGKKGRTFDILAIDACNMCMLELACEIPKYVEFLVASQEEVPDFSFPYDKLLVFGNAKSRSEIAKACRDMPQGYIDAYQDYTRTNATETASITLSSLSLKDGKLLTEPLSRLAHALRGASGDHEKRRAIMEARANSREFVFGLYVDLYNFCERLISALGRRHIADQNLKSACEEIRSAIGSGKDSAFVIANKVSQDEDCHGISIYFPYQTCPTTDTTSAIQEATAAGAQKGNRTEAREKGSAEISNKGEMDFQAKHGMKAPIQRPVRALSRGGSQVQESVGKGGMDVMMKGGMDVMMKMRRQRIEETEQYYGSLEFSSQTHWDKFIRHVWSRWLAEDIEENAKSDPEADMSEVLNCQYSAQQCALNLLSLCRELEGTKAAAKAAFRT